MPFACFRATFGSQSRNSFEELREAFENVVDLHIKVKEQPEKPPQKHLVGRLLSRLRQALHL